MPHSDASAARSLHAAQVFRSDAAAGVVCDPHGERLAILSLDLIREWHAAVIGAFGDAAQDVLYRTGYEWALQDMASLNRRLLAQSGADGGLWTMAPHDVLESWWRPMAENGWGGAHFDCSPLARGIAHINLSHSVVADAFGRAEDPVCHLYAGLFAAALSFIQRAERHCVEIECRTQGASMCRFVVGPGAVVDEAETLRQQHVAPGEIARRMGSAKASQDAKSLPSAPPPNIITTDDGMRVVGAGGGMMRAAQFVFEAERPKSWTPVLKQTGAAAARSFATSLDARLSAAGNLSLASLPLDACLEFLVRHVVENGWGRLAIDTSRATESGVVVASLGQSLEDVAEARREEFGHPLLAGMLQGYFEYVTGQSLRCEEIACMRKGAPHCTFVLTTPDRLQPVASFIGRESPSQIIARLTA